MGKVPSYSPLILSGVSVFEGAQLHFLVLKRESTSDDGW